MKTTTKKTRYEYMIEISNKMRTVIENLKHRKQVNKIVGTEFKKLFPEYTVSVNYQYGLFTISIWGNGLDYNDKFYACINEGNLTWENLLTEIDRCDCSDYVEQLEMEKQFYPELEQIENEIKGLQEKAKNLYPKGYIPKSAKLRSDSCHWESFSYSTKKIFPIALNY